MYYAVYCLEPDNATLAKLEYDFSLDEDFLRSWISGEAFEIMPPLPVVLERGSRGVLPEFVQSPVAVMTTRLFQVLEAAGVSNLETFPTEIHDAKGNLVSSDYVAFNVVGLIRTEDLPSESELKFARLEESVNVLLVHDSIKQAILDAGITTLTFHETSEIAII